MCRLLAWAGREPLTVAQALGEPELEAFTALSRQHADGWGMAWWPSHEASADGEPLIERSTTCAAEDPRFAELTHGASGDAGFVHLRWATPGLPIVTANTHPFTHGRLAFAHNGAVHPQERLDDILPERWRSLMRGTTDSERYFLAIVARLEEGAAVREAVAAVVHHIFGDFEPTSLNAMLLAPDALYVISAHDPARVPPLRASSGGASASTGLDTVFYDLHYRRCEDSVVVASSGFPQRSEDGWEPLENMRLLCIERGTLATTVESLEPSAIPLGS
jgi:predicted glutamine amidotransferase